MLIVADSYLWVQIALLNSLSLASIMITLWYMPLESKKANVFEALNDGTILVLTYHLWCFTDIVKEPETRHELGFMFIAVCLSNIVTHLVFMLYETGIRIKLVCKRQSNRRKSKRLVADKLDA